MNINSLALVKLTDHVDIKPYYENKKLKNTEIYDCLFNRLKLKKVQYIVVNISVFISLLHIIPPN